MVCVDWLLYATRVICRLKKKGDLVEHHAKHFLLLVSFLILLIYNSISLVEKKRIHRKNTVLRFSFSPSASSVITFKCVSLPHADTLCSPAFCVLFVFVFPFRDLNRCCSKEYQLVCFSVQTNNTLCLYASF